LGAAAGFAEAGGLSETAGFSGAMAEWPPCDFFEASYTAPGLMVVVTMPWESRS
jgi:hypothetical protein